MEHTCNFACRYRHVPQQIAPRRLPAPAGV